jgi:hypothetical protein
MVLASTLPRASRPRSVLGVAGRRSRLPNPSGESPGSRSRLAWARPPGVWRVRQPREARTRDRGRKRPCAAIGNSSDASSTTSARERPPLREARDDPIRRSSFRSAGSAGSCLRSSSPASTAATVAVDEQTGNGARDLAYSFPRPRLPSMLDVAGRRAALLIIRFRSLLIRCPPSRPAGTDASTAASSSAGWRGSKGRSRRGHERRSRGSPSAPRPSVLASRGGGAALLILGSRELALGCPRCRSRSAATATSALGDRAVRGASGSKAFDASPRSAYAAPHGVRRLAGHERTSVPDATPRRAAQRVTSRTSGRCNITVLGSGVRELLRSRLPWASPTGLRCLRNGPTTGDAAQLASRANRATTPAIADG